MIATQNIGRYEVLADLGGGAMSAVCLARDSVLGRNVALKTFRRPPAASDEEYGLLRKRLQREARSAASVSHPRVVGIYDVFELEAEGGVFIAMEYVPGSSLEKRMAGGPLATHETLRLLDQMAEALDYIHRRGFVHRDIKPANVLIDEDEQVKLADFGIALPAPLDDTLDTTVFGTPQYMAPEQILGHRMDARTDVFALGVLVFEMLTGEKPFDGETVPDVAHNILSGSIVAAERHMPFGLGPVLRRSLALRPEDRYPSAGEFALAVREALRADPDSTLVSGRVKAAAPRAAVRRTAGPALVTVALLAAVAASLALWRVLATSEEEARAAGYSQVLAEARTQLEEGDPEAAALLFAAAERLSADPREASSLRAAALRAASVVERDRLAAAAKATAESEPAPPLTLGARARAREPASPTGPIDEPVAPAGASGAWNQAPRDAAPDQATPASLMVDIVSEAPAGTVVLYRDDRQILRQPFDFYERHSWFRKVPTGGHLRWNVNLAPGSAVLRVLLARHNEPGEMTELPIRLDAGGRGRLALRLPLSGKPQMRLESR